MDFSVRTLYLLTFFCSGVFHCYLTPASLVLCAGPEQTNIMKEPWFLGMLISTIGGTVWLALCIFSIWLCRKRKHKKKMAQNGMYSGELGWCGHWG